MPPKRFEVAQPVTRGTADVTIGGKDIDGNDWEETFVASRDVPPGVIFDLADLIGRPSPTPGMSQTQATAMYSMAAVNRFMNDVLADDENRDRWRALMADRRRLLPPETAVEVVQYLAEELTGRPTGPANV